jgi:hypothetical protein
MISIHRRALAHRFYHSLWIVFALPHFRNYYMLIFGFDVLGSDHIGCKRSELPLIGVRLLTSVPFLESVFVL